MGISYPLQGQTRDILLTIELHGELHAQELAQRMNKAPNYSIHTRLKELIGGGLLHSRVEKIPGERNRPRRYYRLSAQGRHALELHRAFMQASEAVNGRVAQDEGRPS